MAHFITLNTQPPAGYEKNPGWRSRVVYVRADAVQAVAVSAEGPGCTVQIPAHPNGGWNVKESAEAVLKLMQANV